MEHRVWIANDVNDLVTLEPGFDNCVLFMNVDEEGLSLLIKFMQHQGCAIAIMPALDKEEA